MTKKHLEIDWKNGLVAGNGKSGVLCAVNEKEWICIFQNMDFIIPTKEPRTLPENVSEQLHPARQAVLHKDASWDVDGRKRTYLYPFHPGAQLRITMPVSGDIRWEQQTVYDTQEIRYMAKTDESTITIRTFVSRADDVIISKLTFDPHIPFTQTSLFMDELTDIAHFGVRRKGNAPEKQMKYRTFQDLSHGIIGVLAHYPDFDGSELKECGYLVLSKVLLSQDVILLTKTIRLSHLGPIDTFGEYTGVEQIEKYTRQLSDIAKQYQDETGDFDYKQALLASLKKRNVLFQEVTWNLSDESMRTWTNEEVLKAQKSSDVLLDEAVIRAYKQGRYALENCGGYSAPRLCGMWTGEFNPEWNGSYTMDANVNIQVSGMNTGNLYGSAVGYIYFILKQIPDWIRNAQAVYGMKDSLLAPVNTDGNRAVMVEYDKDYPFQYWNAGASWMMIPIYEFWQCYGNQKIPVPKEWNLKQDIWDLEMEILRPLLQMTMNFWFQLCTPEYYMDESGTPTYCPGKTRLHAKERFLILPSYSPENHPMGYESTITANATMDISAAIECMNMVIRLEKQIADPDSNDRIRKCEQFLKELPDYQLDETGALKEWALSWYQENNEHRHISHLYCAWPSYETQHHPSLKKACCQAVKNRELFNLGKDDTSSHGWIHRALVMARLKDGNAVADILRHLFKSDIFYHTFMTDHDTDRCRGVYCTDTIIGLTGVFQEMLLYSEDDCIEFFPAMAPEWTKGTIKGLRTRNQILVEELEWDFSKEYVRVSLNVNKAGNISVKIKEMEEQQISFETGRYLLEWQNKSLEVKHVR